MYIQIDMEFILLFLFTLISTCYGLTGDNVCQRNHTLSGEEIEYCCNDFQEKNMCLACSPGFRGFNCSNTCPKGYYGRKCDDKCYCNDSQMCHHVCGCLQKSNTTDSITTNNRDVVSSYTVETCFSAIDISTNSTASSDHHNPVYGEEERNRNMDNHTGPEDSGEDLYGTFDRDC